MKIVCCDCETEFRSPTDNDHFRGLFKSFTPQEQQYAQDKATRYCAERQGWVVLAGVWICQLCLVEKARET